MIFRFLLQKFLRVASILLGVTLVMFLLMRAIPGSPWSNYSGSARGLANAGLDQNGQSALTHRFGLDLPLWRQFSRYILGDFEDDGSFFCGAICGNLGPSIQQGGRSVQDVLFAPPENQTYWQSRFGYSIRLVLLGALVALALGLPLGILSAVKPKSASGRAISVILAALISTPNFVLGLLSIVILASGLRIIKVLPDWNDPAAWIVPAIVLAVMPMASIARVTRASLMNIMHEDYIRTARAKGLTQRRVILGHVLRNALVPIITFLGPTLVEMFTGLLIIENLYGFPGFGREYWAAVLALDYPMILGLTLIYATGIVLVNVLIELVCELIDPRIRSARLRGAA